MATSAELMRIKRERLADLGYVAQQVYIPQNLKAAAIPLCKKHGTNMMGLLSGLLQNTLSTLVLCDRYEADPDQLPVEVNHMTRILAGDAQTASDPLNIRTGKSGLYVWFVWDDIHAVLTKAEAKMLATCLICAAEDNTASQFKLSKKELRPLAGGPDSRIASGLQILEILPDENDSAAIRLAGEAVGHPPLFAVLTKTTAIEQATLLTELAG